MATTRFNRNSLACPQIITYITQYAFYNMLSSAPHRQRLILDFLEGREFIQSSTLPTKLGVTPMTVWRDLVAMEERGLIRRSRGRVARADVSEIEPDYNSKSDRAAAAKARIAAYAAKNLIRQGDSLAMDGGTTVGAIARQSLPARLTILTNSVHTAAAFIGHPSRPALYACGGLLREQSGTFIGRQALAFFGRRRVTRYFLSATGVAPEAAVTDLTLEDNEVKQAMARSAKEVILLADGSKWGEVSMLQVLPWRRVHHVVTDAPCAILNLIARQAPHLQLHRV